MRFVFRADAYANSGAGHVMRTSALAEVLIAKNYEVVFIGNTNEIPWVQEFISTLGFYQILEKSDLFTPNPENDVLILDSYSLLPSDTFIAPSKWLMTVAFIDDTSPLYIADLYINPTLESKWIPPEIAKTRQILDGVEYIQIRKSLREVNIESNFNAKLGPRILIVGGGSDPFNFVGELYEILTSLSLDFHATLITPNTNLNVNTKKFSLANVGDGILKILEDTDLVFSTAGTSSWEFLYLGLPLGIASAIENQNTNYQYQTKSGLAVGIGYKEENRGWVFDLEAISDLISHPHGEKRVPNVIDGNGALRLYTKIMQLLESNKQTIS